MHIVLIKQAYRSSNKRDFKNYIIKFNRRLQELQRNVIRNEGFETPKKLESPLNVVRIINLNIFSLHLIFFNCHLD